MSSAMHFEDFSVGQRFVTGGRTVTETDVMTYAYLSGDLNPIHVDEVFARATHFGRRLAYGQLVAILAAGMRTRLGLLEGTAIAMLETTARYLRPVFIGDTITVEVAVTETRLSGKGDRGVVRLGLTVLNQNGEAVQEGEVVQLVRCRGNREGQENDRN
jgi:acyl dehydratase